MSLKHKTITPKREELPEKWYVIDGAGQKVGRLASFIAESLRGKHLPNFAPHMNPNIHIIVTNTAHLIFSGNKMGTKPYYRHTGYPGGLRTIIADKLQEKKPGEILVHSVKGMLPHNRLGRALMKNLRIVPGDEHAHAAQKPEALPFVSK